MDLERGQATLPHLQLTQLNLSYELEWLMLCTSKLCGSVELSAQPQRSLGLSGYVSSDELNLYSFTMGCEAHPAS